jgi:seryl-tRNA synthetase
MKLYELPAAWRDIEAALEETGELTPELAAQLDEVEGALADKVGRYYELVANLSATAEAIKAEEKRLSDRRKQAEKAVESVEERFRDALLAMGKQPKERIFSTDGIHYAELRENPPSVKVECDAATLPSNWQRVIPLSYEPDKKAIKADWEAGVKLPAGVTIERKTKLILK